MPVTEAAERRAAHDRGRDAPPRCGSGRGEHDPRWFQAGRWTAAAQAESKSDGCRSAPKIVKARPRYPPQPSAAGRSRYETGGDVLRRESLEDHRADGDPGQAHDLVPKPCQHPADLALLALGQHQLERGCLTLATGEPGPLGTNLAVGKPDSFGQLVQDLATRGCATQPGRFFPPRTEDEPGGWLARRRWSESSTPCCPHRAGRPRRPAPGHRAASRSPGAGLRDLCWSRVALGLVHGKVDHLLETDPFAIHCDRRALGIDPRGDSRTTLPSTVTRPWRYIPHSPGSPYGVAIIFWSRCGLPLSDSGSYSETPCFDRSGCARERPGPGVFAPISRPGVAARRVPAPPVFGSALAPTSTAAGGPPLKDDDPHAGRSSDSHADLRP